jgi:hypothetical protein
LPAQARDDWRATTTKYERSGTESLFILFAPLEGWREVKVTERAHGD